ncbi:hypothetical protein AGABI1DRAFT_95488 [Agaricus bisporus var. burnettii JB137-S8]|uniref:Uncharacterized protein n=1 Tax=Agaricus bisporus var. burnettii (strain JB137-S8 / ATCC MYA-4627 / FGSC 10392) TaxID=597362 RepID=K5WHA9_AGABU|nr:uncharacterized protein AGABI1DRAFT_95488 [Agaricus bisporus var. burnettii JB137-S8]EKM74626.1 hypothetical protein AGABI1DRAFT_95488 [Agaricus bisporus var. burnettii JB137-S8]
MANNTPALQGPLLLGTQLELVAPTTMAGTLYGIAFTLFCLYVHSLVPRLQDEDRKKQAQFMLGYTSIIMLCGLCNLVTNAWITQDGYIKHVDYPGGPYAYIASTFHTRPASAVAFTCQLAIDTLTSAIQTKIWRLWVIWSATRFAKLVIVLPLLCFLTFFGEANGSAGYIKIVAMLIESYTLESIWLLAEAILLLHPVTIVFAESRNYIEIIAYLLVQYRVASGKAYESQKYRSNISSLHWNHSDHVATQFGEASEVVDDHHGPIKPEADVVQVSSMA